jgi:hypothetical protein
VSQDRPDRPRPASARKLRVNPRNIPLHIFFWSFVIFLLWVFARAMSH